MLNSLLQAFSGIFQTNVDFLTAMAARVLIEKVKLGVAG